MAAIKFKINQRIALVILAIMVSGLFNICLFTFQAKAAAPKPAIPKINFADNNYYGLGEACAADETHEPAQTINRPAAPMPQCCLAQNRNYNALVNTPNDRQPPNFFDSISLPSNTQNFENYSTQYIARLTYPPPAALALASIVIRE